MKEKIQQLLLSISLALISPLIILITFLFFRFNLPIDFLPIDFGIVGHSFFSYISNILIISLVEFGVLSLLLLKREIKIKENYSKAFVYVIYINAITFFVKTIIYKLLISSYHNLNISLFVILGFIFTLLLESLTIKIFFKKDYKESLYLSFYLNFFTSYLVLIIISRGI